MSSSPSIPFPSKNKPGLHSKWQALFLFMLYLRAGLWFMAHGDEHSLVRWWMCLLRCKGSSVHCTSTSFIIFQCMEYWSIRYISLTIDNVQLYNHDNKRLQKQWKFRKRAFGVKPSSGGVNRDTLKIFNVYHLNKPSRFSIVLISSTGAYYKVTCGR